MTIGKKIRVACALIILVAIMGAVQQPREVIAAGLEITPFMAYKFYGEFENVATSADLKADESESYGLILGITDPSGSQFEFFYSHQPTTLMVDGGVFAGTPLFDLDIDYFHIGGASAGGSGKVRPYMAGGFGVTYLDPEVGDPETRFSISIGGGIKVFLTDSMGLRFEGRGFGTFVESDGAVFCSNGNCSAIMKSDVFWQFSAVSGLIVAF